MASEPTTTVAPAEESTPMETSPPTSPQSPALQSPTVTGFEKCSIGIDLGDLWVRVATVNPSQHVPNIVRNNMSNEITPAAVAFQLDAERLVGEDALGKLVSSPQSSVSHLRRLIGADFSSPEFRQAAGLLHCKLNSEQQLVEFVIPGGEAICLPPVQLVATLVRRALHYARAHHKAPEGALPRAVVVNLPQHFNDAQRAALRDALLVAGIPEEAAHLVSDGTANALFWHHAHYSELSVGETKRVAVVDVGHSQSSVSITAVSKTEVRRLASSSVPVGGSAVDERLVQKCLAEASAKHSIDFAKRPKVVARLEREARKCKESLSCVERTRLSCELTDEVDLDMTVERPQLEELTQPLIDAVLKVCADAVAQARAAEGDDVVIDRVEIIGGAARIPVLQAKLAEFWDRPLQRTMDPSQSTAQGCALYGVLEPPTADTDIILGLMISKADHARRSIETIHHVSLVPPLLPIPRLLEPDAIEAMIKSETELEAKDAMYREIANARNALEEYVYNLKGNLDTSEFRKALSDGDRRAAAAVLDAAQDWLQGDGESADREGFLQKLAAVKGEIQERFPGIAAEYARQAAEQAKRDAQLAEEARRAQAENKREPRTDKERLQFAEERKQQGNEMFKQQHYHECIQRYVQSLAYLGELYSQEQDIKAQKTEVSHSCYLNIAAASLKINEYKRAVDNCNKALELKPDSAKAYFRRGQAQAALEDFADARASLNKAAELDPAEKQIPKELAAIQKKEQALLEKQKRMFSKLFD